MSQPSKGKILGALWSRYPVEARVVEVVVGLSNWKWCEPLLGSIRSAIEVQLGVGNVVYVDNHDGRALQAFLRGAAPIPGFRFLPVYRVYEAPQAEAFYQARLP